MDILGTVLNFTKGAISFANKLINPQEYKEQKSVKIKEGKNTNTIMWVVIGIVGVIALLMLIRR